MALRMTRPKDEYKRFLDKQVQAFAIIINEQKRQTETLEKILKALQTKEEVNEPAEIFVTDFERKPPQTIPEDSWDLAEIVGGSDHLTDDEAGR